MFVTIKESFQEGMKRARVKKVINMTKEARTEEEKKKMVCALERGKLESVERGDMLTLAADTVVVHDGKVLGKPKDKAEAFSMLSKLSASTHEVYTGVCIAKGDKIHTFCEKSSVTFYPLTKKQIDAYIETGSPMDKAGSYGLQDDMGITFIRSVSGELSNVIGLPMGRVIEQTERINK